METHYYLSVYPLEALIASQLTPFEYGRYMALGRIRGSNERIMFIEVEGEFGDHFDWEYAETRCVSHADGSPKHSVWLSVYRTLEHVPLKQLRSLFLTTRDGRTLELTPTPYNPPPDTWGYYIYQELCPLHPLVVSSLNPSEFGRYMTDPVNKVSVPSVVFADLKHVNPDNLNETGNIGAAYERNLEHLIDCIYEVTAGPDKPNKNVERSVRSFTYQIIEHAVYVSDGTGIIQYTMPTAESIRRDHYEWGRSAMIL